MTKRCKVILQLLAISLCVSVLVFSDYPPSAHAQSDKIEAINSHLQATDGTVTRQWNRMNDNQAALTTQITDLKDRLTEKIDSIDKREAVMEGNFDLIKWMVGGLVVIFGGQLALSWRQKKVG